MISEAEAHRITAGIQSGDVDSFDVWNLVTTDPEVWIAESESWTAREIRAKRAERV